MDVRYTNKDFQFFLRVSALIFNEDESKILLFNVTGRDFYMLPGGKINELEESIDAIKREIKGELGWDNLTYSFLGVSEEFVNDKGFDNHQINLIYKGIYHDVIKEDEFKGLEGDWISFKWINKSDLDNYKIYPNIVYKMVENTGIIYYSIDNLIKYDCRSNLFS